MDRSLDVVSVYQYPAYYELAFSFRNILAEVDVFETLIQRYAYLPVATMLDVACGPAPHLCELTRRGYHYIGLDLSPTMLDYARHKARAQTVDVATTFVIADLRDFRLNTPVDFAFIMLGSLYVQSTAELSAHFDAMAAALKPGGLYLLDWCIDFSPSATRHVAWEIEAKGVTVKALYEATPLNVIEQTIEETMALVVEENGTIMTLRERAVRREIYPQEFLLFCAQRRDFEFVGWWNDWELTQPLDGTQAINRPISVVRRI
ncbi:MAG: class I SAM-dependent methyltransferase [bacterium]|nr:class I SAM-dependent methyltransferase [bacterium]